MSTTSSNAQHEECVPAAQVRVLWAARTPPNLSRLKAAHVGLGCIHVDKEGANSAKIVEPLTSNALTAIADAHLLFVVSDFESEAWAQQIDQACKRANRSNTFRVFLHDDNDAEAACIAIRSMTEMLNVYSFIGIDIEDVQSVLNGPGAIKIATAVASGEGRAHTAAIQALAEATLRTHDLFNFHDVLLILSAAPHKLRIAECTLAANMIRARLSSDKGVVYGMNNDESLGDAIRVTVFVKEALA